VKENWRKDNLYETGGSKDCVGCDIEFGGLREYSQGCCEMCYEKHSRGEVKGKKEKKCTLVAVV